MITPPNTSSRPRIALPRTALDSTLEVLGLAIIAGTLAWLVSIWTGIPARVPQHFDFAGHVDRWGDRSTFVVLPIIGIVLYAGLSALQRVPHIFNFPVAVTEANAPRLYRAGVSMIRWLKVEIVAMFGVLQWETVQVAIGAEQSMPNTLVLCFVALILGTVGVFVVKMMKKR